MKPLDMDSMIEQTAQSVVHTLSRRNMTVTTVESCTGGMVASAITSVAGSSAVFHQGFVTYCDEAKHHLVGVRKRTLRRDTAVSAQTAKEMAEGGGRRSKADIGISLTGYAGPPSGDEKEEVGLVFIGCCVRGKTWVKECHFAGDRTQVRKSACMYALLMAQKLLGMGQTGL